MTARPLVAFYAPMKGPDHPVPSGDRTVARLYCAALRAAGFDVDIVSDLRCYDGKGDGVVQRDLMVAAEIERTRLLARWAQPNARKPLVWFTYHLYHKAPDLLGPEIADRLGIVYAVAEPSHAPKRAGGAWDAFFQRSEAAIRRADVAFISTAADAECVMPLRMEQHSIRLAPFLAVPDFAPDAQHADINPVRLIVVAMMRAGDKAMSYQLLASALNMLRDLPWDLTVIGDGDAAPDIHEYFSPVANRTKFLGAIADGERISSLLRGADVFVWPAVNEAYGMALLEASAHGVAVVAGREGGVADVVMDGRTGLLAAPRDAADFAARLRLLLTDRALRQRLGVAGADFVRAERSLDHAAAVLRAVLMPLIERRPSCG